MGGGPVVVREEGGPGAVVALESPDEPHRGVAEGVDVLVVVADREQGELLVAVLEGPARDGGDQRELLRTEVLVLVDEHVAEPAQQPRTGLVGVLRRQPAAVQQRDGLLHHVAEGVVVERVGAADEAGADQAHGEAVTPEHRDRACVVADQRLETPPAAGPARDLDDAPPRFRRGLARDVGFPVRQPAVQEVLLGEPEVVHRQRQGVGHRLQAALRELGHHVDLQTVPGIGPLAATALTGTVGHIHGFLGEVVATRSRCGGDLRATANERLQALLVRDQPPKCDDPAKPCKTGVKSSVPVD